MAGKRRLLVVDVAALGWNIVSSFPPPQQTPTFQKINSIFPALTCPVQAAFRTASQPDDHGIVANGLYSADFKRISFWEQAASLVSGARIWDSAKQRGATIGMLFWQQSLGENVDVLLSPKPIHKHHGGMIQDCHSRPHDLYKDLCQRVGGPSNLMNYWGPLANRKSSDWIVASLQEVMKDPSPDVLFGYIPHLDYDLQRFGPRHPKAERAVAVVYQYLADLRSDAELNGYEVLFFGDCAMETVTGAPVFPNSTLREAGLLSIRSVRGMTYPSLYDSPAFAMVDHQVAHVYTQDADTCSQAATVLGDLPGVERVLTRSEAADLHLAHSRCGDLVMIADAGRWFAYPWWEEKREAPDYAGHVDIHNKPGYDPCELFFGWPPPSTSMNTSKIRGTHGRTGPGYETAWQSSITFSEQPRTLVDLARGVQEWLAESS